MIHEKMEKAFNEQINKELYSSYLYLSMAAYFQNLGLSGFANWMRVQVQEENFHAMKMFDYVINRGGKVILETIDKPEYVWKSVLEVYEETLKHEEYVTSLIYKLSDVADEVKDRASISFLQWFIDEQVEEEATASDVIAKLKLISDNGDALYAMDKEFAARVFTPPVDTAAN